MGFISRLLGKDRDQPQSRVTSAHGLDELARRLLMSPDELMGIEISYREFSIPKRSGRGMRAIAAPAPNLMAIQRRILRRVLRRLRTHDASMGFERGRSIVTNAALHVRQPVVLRFDIRDFFTSTDAKRVFRYFQIIGWDRQAAGRLAELCTWRGGLPQGAPTSPRLASLVNWRLDARLDALAHRHGAIYTRYADDLTFSFVGDDRDQVKYVAYEVKQIVAGEGYRLNLRKLRIIRRHQQQRVTGLIVNERVNLARSTRRRLRAVEHHLRTGRPATLTEQQLQGWRALQSMVETQRGGG
jgi:retron-type reverse transcriptase